MAGSIPANMQHIQNGAYPGSPSAEHVRARIDQDSPLHGMTPKSDDEQPDPKVKIYGQRSFRENFKKSLLKLALPCAIAGLFAAGPIFAAFPPAGAALIVAGVVIGIGWAMRDAKQRTDSPGQYSQAPQDTYNWYWNQNFDNPFDLDGDGFPD